MSKAIVPRSDLSHDLGKATERWGNVYAGTVIAGVIEANEVAGGLQADIDSRATKTEVSTLEATLQADIDSRCWYATD